MSNLIVKEILLRYEEPLVVIARDSKDKKYIGVNYGDGEKAYLFHFSRVLDEHIDDLYEQRFDLRYLITKMRRGQPQLAEIFGTVGEAFKPTPTKDLEEDWLPETGLFLSEEYRKEKQNAKSVVHIDGRWDIDDLNRFSNLVQDAYAFVYALNKKGNQATWYSIADKFHRYPWRGGFSSVNFFSEIYKSIPTKDRAKISRIQYASPGTIEFAMNSDVSTSIHNFVSNINSQKSSSREAYTSSRKYLRDKKWLGRAKDDLELSSQDNEELLDHVSKLAIAFALDKHKDDIIDLANKDPLAAVKILLAYFRRLEGLADYVATGKAQQLFA